MAVNCTTEEVTVGIRMGLSMKVASTAMEAIKVSKATGIINTILPTMHPTRVTIAAAREVGRT